VGWTGFPSPSIRRRRAINVPIPPRMDGLGSPSHEQERPHPASAECGLFVPNQHYSVQPLRYFAADILVGLGQIDGPQFVGVHTTRFADTDGDVAQQHGLRELAA